MVDAAFSWRQLLPWGIWVNAPLGNGLSSAQASMQGVLGRRVRWCWVAPATIAELDV